MPIVGREMSQAKCWTRVVSSLDLQEAPSLMQSHTLLKGNEACQWKTLWYKSFGEDFPKCTEKKQPLYINFANSQALKIFIYFHLKKQREGRIGREKSIHCLTPPMTSMAGVGLRWRWVLNLRCPHGWWGPNHLSHLLLSPTVCTSGKLDPNH